MYYVTKHPSPLGLLTLSCDEDENLVGLWMEGQKYFQSLPEQPQEQDSLPIFARTKDWLMRYFAGERPEITQLPLAPIGGAFRQEVWKLLCEIPYGETTTYGALARKIAQKQGRAAMSSQAIGGAVGHNPISIIIPCHRVVGSNGSLTGYAGGIEKKVRLLDHEGVDLRRYFVPQKGTAL